MTMPLAAILIANTFGIDDGDFLMDYVVLQLDFVTLHKADNKHQESMEQVEASGSNHNHSICYKLAEQGMDGEGLDMESLADDFQSLLIGDENSLKHHSYSYSYSYVTVTVQNNYRLTYRYGCASVPPSSEHLDAELLAEDVEIHSDVEVSSFDEQGWCKIIRNSDLCYATLQNKSLNVKFVDRTDVPTEDAIISGPGSDGLGCERAFCGAYCPSQLITRADDSYHTGALKPITKRCIEKMGKTLQDVVSEYVTKLDHRELDITRMPLNYADMSNSGTPICNDCYEKLVSFFLYWFRISLPKCHLPDDAAQREDCWYGYTCRTQHHNDDHAIKRNHVCPPIRGSIGN
ncbi:hypothetical protein E3N88_13851 [Mikania micrantha]|uniref:E3 ubiquitin-protein ligase CHFR cysteine rich domain-containing protein n=1 Tax=Mikania micrantha TaxID=192012 RepID=A0A5N6P1G2_9ASTR|nr:hypothetical protein E3N88_13851 [Mikania micrantha]